MASGSSKGNETMSPFSLAFVLVILRFALYLITFSCSIVIIHGISTSMRKSAVLGHDRCLLSAKFGEKRTAFWANGSRTNGLGYLKSVEGGSPAGCHFVLFVASLQLVLSLVMTGFLAVRLFRRMLSVETLSEKAIYELLAVVPMAVFAFCSAIVVSAGVSVTCNEILDHWRDQTPTSRSVYFLLRKPEHCSGAFVFTGQSTINGYHYVSISQIKTAYFFFADLESAEVAGWICLLWIVHIVISSVGFHKFRKEQGRKNSRPQSSAKQTTDVNI